MKVKLFSKRWSHFEFLKGDILGDMFSLSNGDTPLPLLFPSSAALPLHLLCPCSRFSLLPSFFSSNSKKSASSNCGFYWKHCLLLGCCMFLCISFMWFLMNASLIKGSYGKVCLWYSRVTLHCLMAFLSSVPSLYVPIGIPSLSVVLTTVSVICVF